MTVYDRYLLGRFAAVYAVCFIAFFGLFAVFDGFINLDGFQYSNEQAGGTTLDLLAAIGLHYTIQFFVIFDMLGPTLVIVSTMVVLAMGLKFGEIHPLLAAGVRGYRICLPLVIASLTVSGLLALNRELVLPSVAHRVTGSHGKIASDELTAEPLYDSHGIFISAEALRPKERTIRGVQFRLPAPDLATDYSTIEAERGRYIEEAGDIPGHWVLEGVTTPVDQLGLTEAGQEIIRASRVDADKACVITTCSFEELSDRSTSFQYMGTPRLIRRIRKTPATDTLASAQVVSLHTRLASPILGVIGVLLAAPLVVRRERWSIVGNMATAMVVVGIVYGISQGSAALGQANLIAADLSVWAPLIIGGGLAAWLAPEMRT